MRKFVITTALALVLAGGAYAQGQHHGGPGGGGGGMGGGGGGMGAHVGGGGMGGGGGPGGMSHGTSGPSNFSSMSRGPSGRSNFAQGPQGGTLYNQEHRDIRRDQRGQFARQDRNNGRNLYNRQSDFDRGRFDRDNRIGRDVDRNRGADFRHRGVVSGNFFEHGRHFRFRRFFNGEWVFLNAWDDCSAWAWVNVAPGVWAWRPINVCIG